MLKQRLKDFFLRDSSKWKFWVLIAFICKGILFAFLLYKNKETHGSGFLGETGGDTWSYLVPIDNFISHGSYIPDYRMPGYGILYIPFALLFSKAIACNILIICQFILASISVYTLALIAKHVFKSASIFYLTFYLFAISTYSNLFDATLLTESFATSFLIFSVYYLLKSVQSDKKRIFNSFLSGLFLTEVIFLRPVFMPMLIIFLIVIIVSLFREKSLKQNYLRIFIFIAPFLFFDGIWTARNYHVHHKFTPAHSSIYYEGITNSYNTQLYTLVRSWGGSDLYWEPDAEIRWFGINDGLQPELHNKQVSLPTNIYTSKFNYDSLLVLKKQIAIYNSHQEDTIAMRLLLTSIREKCLSYANSIKTERPFLYYVTAPLKRTKVFLIHSGTYNLFSTLTSQLDTVSYSVKVFYSLFYLLIIGFGFAGMILLFKRSMQFTPVILIASIVFYTILIHPIILGMCEKRYFVPAYPYMLICAAYALLWIYKKLSAAAGK